MGRKKGHKKDGEKSVEAAEPPRPKSTDSAQPRPQNPPPRPATQPEPVEVQSQEQPPRSQERQEPAVPPPSKWGPPLGSCQPVSVSRPVWGPTARSQQPPSEQSGQGVRETRPPQSPWVQLGRPPQLQAGQVQQSGHTPQPQLVQAQHQLVQASQSLQGPQQQQPAPTQPQQQLPRSPPQQPPQEQSSRSPHQASSSSKTSPRASPEANAPPGEGITLGITSLQLGLSSGIHPPLKISRPPLKNKSVCRPIIVETNHLALTIKDSKKTVYHYDVVVKPEKPFRLYWPALVEVQRRFYPKNWPAFDGRKNIYSALKLPFPVGDELVASVTVFDEESHRDKDVDVVIKFVKAVSLHQIGEYLRSGRSTMPPQEAIQAIDVVLRQPATARFTRVGRSFFTPPDGQVISLGDGLDLWYGFFQSAIIGQKPFLNIDVAHKGFPSAVKCVDALGEFTRDKKIAPNSVVDARDVDKFAELIKGLKIAYALPNSPKRTYKVNSVGQPANQHRFKLEDGTQLTVAEYFRNTKNYNLKYPLVPVLLCGAQNRLAFPAELCTIVPGQVVLKKLNEIQTRNMVSRAATPAPDRKNKIYESLKMADFGNSPHLKEFGLNVDTKFTRIKARVLRAPSLLYKNRNVSVVKGVWNPHMFLQSHPLTNWVIYCVDSRTREENLRALEGELIRTGKELGMDVRQASQIQCIRLNSDYYSLFKDCLNRHVQLIIFVLNDKGPYATVKKVAETEVGILTQCLKSRTIMKLSKATVTNILLKVNSKLNGINHNIVREVWPKFLANPVMVVGADVTHPSPDQIDIPSVAAVAASHDPSGFNYNMEWRLQGPREEMIQDLTIIMKKQLLFFHEKTKGLKPQAILFYRDGVSEGQFKMVLNQEVQAIRRACAELSPEYKPPITFLVVQKRHHTRFFPTCKEDEDGRNKNVPAGTIVDTTITHPTEVDFYLVSHASIQGTSRPTKYHLLWDDSDMSVDELEEITYYLCHLFSRCTRSVSYPAPTYYAHLAAFRIRYYIENMKNLGACQTFQSQVTTAEIHSRFTKSSPMFFV